jgi:Multicopper oxidase
MRLFERIWASATCVLNFLTLSPVNPTAGELQGPLLSSPGVPHHQRPKGPIFRPPGHGEEAPDSKFTCDYSNMPGCVPCSTPEDRTCWLKCDNGVQYDINTNYEDTNQTPIGIHRTYYLNITDSSYNADGLNFNEGKFFNATYPGPWIQACWGDVRISLLPYIILLAFHFPVCHHTYSWQNVTVIVSNKLKSNGTSIHWHGIRQWLTMHMDGVNGVTQCPIAPGDSFNYTWRAMQYGSSWYHSHYSVQYADGAVGPLVSLLPIDTFLHAHLAFYIAFLHW